MYKILPCAISSVVFLSVLLSIIPYQAHGDGFTQENVYANVGNRTMAMFIKINPPIITAENLQDRYMLLNFFDADTNKPVRNVSFFLNVTKGDQELLYDLFYTQNGTIVLKFQPGGTVGKWTVFADTEPITGGYYSINGDPIELQAPILSEGGLYHFNMTLQGFDYPNEFVGAYSKKINFNSYLSVGSVYNQIINYNTKAYNSTIVSYFDKILNMNFDPSKLQFSWSMPFDWNPDRYQNRPFLVHEEVRVPNSFGEFLNAPTFSASVNGRLLNPFKIIIDPFSLANTTIIHLFFNRDDMNKTAQTINPNTQTMNFTLFPSKTNLTTSTDMFTDFGGWEIKLAWSPANLAANTQNNIKMTFFDQQTNQQVTNDVNYNLKILDARGNLVQYQSNQTAKGGIGITSIFLPTNGIYTIQAGVTSVVSNGIFDTTRNGLARGTLVIPSTTIPEFPLSEAVLAVSIAAIIIVTMRKNILTL